LNISNRLHSVEKQASKRSVFVEYAGVKSNHIGKALRMVHSPAQLEFPAVHGKPIVACFDGGDITSDAGVLLLAQAEDNLGLVAAMAQGIADTRQLKKIRHPYARLLRERVFAIACGYEDANDLDVLKNDPALKLACGRTPRSDPALASQPTISRLENAVGGKDLARMGLALARRVIAQLPAGTEEVVLDVDATDDPCHGQQEFEFFNGYYDNHCYLPLHVHLTGPDGRQWPLASLLRPGNASYRTGLFSLLRRAVRLLRARFPDVRIVLRADAGFGYGDVLSFCEAHSLDYLLGLTSNNRLAVLSTPVQMDACLKYRWEGDGCREFAEFCYKAKSWPAERRVVAKAEITGGALNPRYVVTNLTGAPEQLYRRYCGRGEQENRIKEIKLDLASGRTSCHRFAANQMRLLLHTAACVLMTALQEAAHGTVYARAQVGTFRLRLLKVAARVVESCRRVRLYLSSSYADQPTWFHLNRRLSAPRA